MSGSAWRIAGQVLHADVAKHIGAALQLGVEPLQHAEAEFPVAFDRDHAGMGQLMRGIGLEFDPLLEVDQIQLDFVGLIDAAPGS